MTSEDSPALRRHVANRAARRARDMKPPVKVRAVQPALPGVALERDLTIARFVDETAWRIGAIATAKKRAALAEIEVLEALEAEWRQRADDEDDETAASVIDELAQELDETLRGDS